VGFELSVVLIIFAGMIFSQAVAGEPKICDISNGSTEPFLNYELITGFTLVVDAALLMVLVFKHHWFRNRTT
jgi:hypothetical protein